MIGKRRQDLQTAFLNAVSVVHAFDLLGILLLFLRKQLIVLTDDRCQILAVFAKEKVVKDRRILQNSFSESLPDGKEGLLRRTLLAAVLGKGMVVLSKVLERGQQNQMLQILEVEIDGGIVKSCLLCNLADGQLVQSFSVDQFLGCFDKTDGLFGFLRVFFAFCHVATLLLFVIIFLTISAITAIIHYYTTNPKKRQ